MVLRRMGKIFIPQFQAAPRDGTQSSPCGIGRLKYFLYDLPGLEVPFRAYTSSVLDFYFTTGLFSLVHQHLNGLQDVHRLKTADHAGFTVLIHHGLVGSGANDGSYMSRAEEAVYVHLLGRQESVHGRRQ